MSVYIPAELRRRVRAHFLQRCAYCQSSEALTVVTFTHPAANRVMGITDEGADARLFHPQRDSWLDHFDWSVNRTVIVGLTEIGVATIDLLRMNRPQLVEVRSLWGFVGKHPPN